MTCTIRTFEASDRDWAVAAQTDLYQTEYGFDDSFGVVCGQIIDDFLRQHDPERENAWVAEESGRPLGTIFCVGLSPEAAQLRLFFLLRSARGQGLGRALLSTCMQFAKDTGYKEMQLRTHRSHTGATALYRKSGWSMIAEEEALSFGRQEVIETYIYRF